MVTPFSGKLTKIMFRPKNSQNGNVTLDLYRALDGEAYISNGILIERITVAMPNSASFASTFAASGSDHFGPGDMVGVKLTPNASPGDCQMTCVWEFNQEE